MDENWKPVITPHEPGQPIVDLEEALRDAEVALRRRAKITYSNRS
jgi:hypothetical protein